MKSFEQLGFRIKRIAIHSLILIGVVLVLAVIWTIFNNIFQSAGAPSSSLKPSVFMGSDLKAEPSPNQLDLTEKAVSERSIIITVDLEVKVLDASDTLAKIQATAVALDGFIESSQIRKIDSKSRVALITIRIPQSDLNEAMAQIKQSVLEVESEVLSQADVTEQVIDLKARLTNAQAQEQQYLVILKTAKTVEEVLQVNDKLSSIRELVEQLEGQIKYFDSQVALATINVDIVEQADIEIFGIQWRPLFEVKKSFRGLLDGLVEYLNSVIAIVFALPTIILWIFSVVIIIHYGWKVVIWLYRTFLKS